MFQWFNNMKMGLKLTFAFVVIAMLIGGVVGSLGYYNLVMMNGQIDTIIWQDVPSVEHATAVERYALRTILDEKNYLVFFNDSRADASTYQKSAMGNIDQILKSLDEVDKVAKQYNDQDLLAKSAEVRKVTLQYRELYNQGVAKLQANKKLADTLAQKGDLVTTQAKAYFQGKMTDLSEQGRQAIDIVADIRDTALMARLHANKYMLYKDKADWDVLEANVKKLAQRYEDLKAITTADIDLQSIAIASRATNEYYQAAEAWARNDSELQIILAQMAEIGKKVQDNAMAAEDAGWKAVNGAGQSAAGVMTSAIYITMGAVLAAILASIILAVVISRSITTPLSFVLTSAEQLAVGDLGRDLDPSRKNQIVRRKDELGQLGQAFTRMTDEYLQPIAATAAAVAGGDLTVQVKSSSARDELGQAFARMVASLKDSIGQVALSAENLALASTQLAGTANQAGQATSQIAATVQQVAKGAAQQSESVTRTAASVEQMSRAIDGMARGAQEQAGSVGKASSVTSQITAAIQQVSGNAQTVTRDSAGAADSARNGARIVRDTIDEMQSIKSKVGLSAQKVQEMGQRSDQIGAIVETIDDIASQTNLLALNAAIEAARAGEHGKGFAVVADEVRKLAERSSTATKEIGGLIRSIQKTVGEAVSAMDESAREVEAGASHADQAGQALADILSKAESVFVQAEQAAQAAQQMNRAAEELVHAVDSVSAVVEENIAATEQMAASSGEVTRAIENIASVSEENSAAVEEVSASAQSLSEMARALQEVVAQFHLDGQRRTYRPAIPQPVHPSAVEKFAPIPTPVTARNGHHN
jgi:methyl-accepting chemotaxis protein